MMLSVRGFLTYLDNECFMVPYTFDLSEIRLGGGLCEFVFVAQ